MVQSTLSFKENILSRNLKFVLTANFSACFAVYFCLALNAEKIKLKKYFFNLCHYQNSKLWSHTTDKL